MTYFAFCIHNHQPVGNFPHVLEDAYENAYWPFLKLLSKYPSVKLTLHTSGFLLDWIARSHPEYIGLLKEMVSARQVEIMGGAHYEPVLSVIPECDRIGQIKMMADRIEELFGARPRGIWLAERVWEPTLPTTLKNAGVEYLLVDDYHFVRSGIPKEELGGYYITEDMGNTVKIFPGSETMRYMIPFQPVDSLEGYLRSLKTTLTRGKAAIYGDDGEKFGVWPGTHKSVYDEGWLKAFFKKIEESADWLRPVTLAGLIDAEDPLGRVYLPTTSYMEMGEWALPAPSSRAYGALMDDAAQWDNGSRIKQFVQGGIWRNFMAKYPEANWMHKRMLMVSMELGEARALKPGDKTLGEATRALYKAQCNDAYWHGVFGGLYLPHLRTAVYENLLTAERLVAEARGGGGNSIEKTDMDADGNDEVILKTAGLNLFFSPGIGGGLYEFDYMKKALNLSNVLTRWPEGYHHKLEKIATGGAFEAAKSIHDLLLVKEKGLDKLLTLDTRRRGSFVEHVIGRETTFAEFSANTHAELADFPYGRFECLVDDDGKGFSLSKWSDVKGVSVFVAKEIRPLGADGFTVSYRVDNDIVDARDDTPGEVLLAVELNLLLPCCDGPACLYNFKGVTPCEGARIDGTGIGLGSAGELSGVEGVSLIDKFTGVCVTIEVSTPVRLWRFPIYSVSLSEAGFEKIFQGACLVFLMPVNLDAPASTGFSFSVRVEAI
ncbi:MAG: DUF1926 domain-containing protein [Deltaproteobacteria bacterium]|nr:DUF1926 domain-containing protein [Deltaproteobacteria bacterium]